MKEQKCVGNPTHISHVLPDLVSAVTMSVIISGSRSCILGCPTKNVKYDFRGGSARLQNFKLLPNCRKKNQPDWCQHPGIEPGIAEMQC
jgi:hypothetical protein